MTFDLWNWYVVLLNSLLEKPTRITGQATADFFLICKGAKASHRNATIRSQVEITHSLSRGPD